MYRPERVPGPAARYQHPHRPPQNVNQVFEERLSPGGRIADRIAAVVGSWPFIIIQSAILGAWILTNLWLAVTMKAHPDSLKAWDPYPFILLNLVLSFQAAYTGPVVMMSQNRQANKDRLIAQEDYEINKKAEEELRIIMEHLTYQDAMVHSVIDELLQVSMILGTDKSIPAGD
ncbi:MAG: hypothetical protein COS85_22890 [Armatimonadetes bacterium CG07_land_8_20_14_0_80_59_28]|nr:MAG: hypothetical protein COS85_22890 [Armatimonadetes bacterium CG07_land_8_20_14_0_80_59_28]